MKYKFLLTLSILVFLASLPACATMTVPGRQIRTADILYQGKKYHEAASAYRLVIRNYPNSRSAADARYGLALILVSSDNPQKDYAQALLEFEEFLKLYPEHEQAHEAQNWRQVLRTLERLNKNIEDLKQLDIKHEEKRLKK